MFEATGGDGAEIKRLYDGKKPLKEIVTPLKDAFEKKIIEEVMAQANGNKAEAARRLKVDYTTLYRKIRFHEIEWMSQGTR
jgi:DNA-binding NtrC family response regulator